MHVRMKTGMVGPSVNRKANHVYEVTDAEGARLVAKDLAVVDDPAPAKKAPAKKAAAKKSAPKVETAAAPAAVETATADA